jgi:hypothetical protein
VRAAGVSLEIVGTQRGLNRVREAAQDAVLVEAAYGVEQVGQLLLQTFDFGAALGRFHRGVELSLEQLRQDGGDVGV